MDEQKLTVGRRSLLTGMGAAAAGALTPGATGAQRRNSGFRPARHDGDAWLDELPGQHRVLIDTSYALGGAEALLYANNILNAHADAYDGKDEDYAIVICWRHHATPFAWDDAAWEKYGELLSRMMEISDEQAGRHFEANPMNLPGRPDLLNGTDTIDKTTARGVRIAICNHATQEIAKGVAAMTGGSVDEIYSDFVAAAVPESRFVPAGVLATTRAQEYGYSLLFSG